MRRAQGSVEYIFMVATSLVILLFVIRRLLDPQVGTAKEVENIACDTQEKLDSNLSSMLSNSTS